MLVGNLAEGGIVPVTRISRGTADDEAGLEYLCLLRQTLVVDELS